MLESSRDALDTKSKNDMKRIILFSTLIYFCLHIGGQTLQLRGKVVSGKAPVEFANVILKDNDSIFISGGTTDQQGRFSITNLDKGNYNLQISSIGYQTRQIEIKDFTSALDLGNISIDSATIALNEVVVKGNPVIHQADKKILLPTSYQLKSATNGLKLLQNMQLNRIQVDPLRKTIKSSDEGEVQLRINGAKVEIEEINSLRPEDIIRIEYHDTPSLRYGHDVAAVIDYIVRHRETGGYFALDANISPHTAWGDYTAVGKANYKRSEWNVNYRRQYRGLHFWRENEETFKRDETTTFTRLEDGIPNKSIFNYDRLNLNYNYQKDKDWLVNIGFRNRHTREDQNIKSNLYSVDQPDQQVLMKDLNRSKYYSQSVDAYLQRNLKNQQALILNVVGTYTHNNDDRDYTESLDATSLTAITSGIKGEKYSIITEGIYERPLGKGKISTGLYHRQSISKNNYMGTVSKRTQMQEAHSSAYAEYTGKFGKFTLIAGLKGYRSWYNQSDKGYENYTILPRLRMTYNLSNNSYIKYRGEILKRTPNLGDMSDVRQLIDSLQIRQGNPNLKLSTIYNNVMNIYFKKGLFSTNLTLFHQYQHRPVMEETVREGQMFIRTNNNQKSWQKFNPEAEFRFGPIKDILTVSFTTGLNYFDSRGNNYHHTYSNWYYMGEIMASYKKWSFFFQMQNHRNDFYGETLRYGENYHLIGLTYRYKQLNVGVITINPFINDYKQGSEKFNSIAPSKNWFYIKESSRLFAINVSWNISFGRKYDSRSRRLNNEDSGTSTLKSGKQ